MADLSHTEPATLIGCLARNAADAGSTVALRERDLGLWQEWSWARYRDEVLAIAAGLEELGFAAGEPAILIGDNRARLYVAMVAIIALRGLPSPVYPEVSPDEMLHLTRSDMRFAIAEDQEQVDKLLELRARIGAPQHIVYTDPRGLGGYGEPGLVDYEALRESGRARLEREARLADDLLGRAQPNDGAVLLHSSGTTGHPKRILLKHKHALAAVRGAAAADYFGTGEEYVAYLPMAWVGDFVFAIAGHLALRFVLNLPERQETVMHDTREIAPTLYFASARAWDNLLTRLKIGIAESTPLKRRMVDGFLDYAVGVERRRLDGGRPSGTERLALAIGRALVFRPLLDHVGLGRVRHCYTAGEAIGQDTFLFFRALGLDLKQFYGSSETCALIAAQDSAAVRLHTVGRALPGMDIRIDDHGEILVRGPGVFDGYLDDADATARTLVDGWLHTGDAGHLEADGQLVVLGRVSEVVHTAAGERFIPNFIENQIKFSPYVKDVAVTGAGRDALGALVCIDIDAVGHWAQTKDVAYHSYADLSQKPEVRNLVRGVVREVNTRLPEPLRIRRFANLHKAFDPDDGEVTRTRKLRRNVIEDRYAEVIDALHAGRAEVSIRARITYETGEVGEINRTLAVTEAA